MLRSYVDLLRVPGAARLVATSLTGRLSLAVLGVPLVIIAERASGSYGVAGIAAGAFSVGVAVSAPIRGRLIDRRGARTALPPLVATHAAALFAVAAAGEARLTPLVVFAAAAAGVSAPGLPAAMRLEWQQLLGREDARLDQAYAFESVAQVSLFIVGPVLAGAGIAVVGPAWTMVLAGLLALAGGLAFARSSRVAGTRPGLPERATTPIRIPGVRTLVVVTVLADAALGAVSVAVIAFSEQRASAAVAGPLLALFSASSVIGGAAYGAVRWTAPPQQRLVSLLLVATLALLPLVAADSLSTLGILLVIAGAPFAAQWATTSRSLDHVAPSIAAAEAYNWLSAANSAGVAAGSLSAGFLIDAAGTQAGFGAAAAGVGLAALFAVVREDTLAVVRSSG
jgi:MFS family permease